MVKYDKEYAEILYIKCGVADVTVMISSEKNWNAEKSQIRKKRRGERNKFLFIIYRDEPLSTFKNKYKEKVINSHEIEELYIIPELFIIFFFESQTFWLFLAQMLIFKINKYNSGINFLPWLLSYRFSVIIIKKVSVLSFYFHAFLLFLFFFKNL